MVNTLRPGSSLVAAGYCLYSSSVFFCLTLGSGVNIFTLDRQIGEFVLTNPKVRIPKRGKIYSFNEANRNEWDQPLQDYLHAIQTGWMERLSHECVSNSERERERMGVSSWILG